MTNQERYSDSYYDAVITQLQLTTSAQTATIMDYEKRLCDVDRLANRVILIGEEEGWFEWKGDTENGGNHSSLHRDLTRVANQRVYKDFCDAHVRMIKSLEQRIADLEHQLNRASDENAHLVNKLSSIENRSCYSCSEFREYTNDEKELHFEDGICLHGNGCAYRVYQDYSCSYYEPKDK